MTAITKQNCLTSKQSHPRMNKLFENKQVFSRFHAWFMHICRSRVNQRFVAFAYCAENVIGSSDVVTWDASSRRVHLHFRNACQRERINIAQCRIQLIGIIYRNRVRGSHSRMMELFLAINRAESMSGPPCWFSRF